VIVRISERVPVEVTEVLAVFVGLWDEVILELLDPVTDVEGVFEVDEELLTVPVLATVLDMIALRDTLPVLLDVLLCDVEPVIVAELDGVLDCLAEAVSDHERSGDNVGSADILSGPDTE